MHIINLKESYFSQLVKNEIQQHTVKSNLCKIVKNEGILLGGCLTVKNYWGLLSGDNSSLFSKHYT